MPELFRSVRVGRPMLLRMARRGSDVIASTRYVAIPADRLVDLLDRMGASVASTTMVHPERDRPPRCSGRSYWTRAGAERVFVLVLPGHPEARPAIKVLTTLDGGTAVRDCGEDAVRVIVGMMTTRNARNGSDAEQFVPIDKPVRLLRTAPRAATEQARVDAWVARFTAAMREAYRRARSMPRCPACGAVMAERSGWSGPFLGCRRYPECKQTRPAPKMTRTT